MVLGSGRSEFVFGSEQDNVEQRQSEQRQQEVLQEALQDTMLDATDPQKPLSSREGRLNARVCSVAKLQDFFNFFFFRIITSELRTLTYVAWIWYTLAAGV